MKGRRSEESQSEESEKRKTSNTLVELGRAQSQTEGLGMSWRGRHGEHGDQGMEEGDPRNAKKSRNPMSSKDRAKRPNDAGQS